MCISDSSLTLVKAADKKKFFNEKNYGKGFCIRKGIEESTGDIIMIQDADMRTAPLALSYFAGNKRYGDPAITAAAAIWVALPVLIVYVFLFNNCCCPDSGSSSLPLGQDICFGEI